MDALCKTFLPVKLTLLLPISCRQGSVIYPPARGNLTFMASDLQESGCVLDINNKAPKGHWACIVYACLVSLPKMNMCEWRPIRKYQTKRIMWLSFLLSDHWLLYLSITYKIIIWYSKTSLSKMLSVLSSIILLQHFPSHPLCQTLLAPSSLEVLRVEIASEIIVTNILKPQRIDRKFPEFQDPK